MNFIRTNFLSALFAASSILSTIIPLIIIVVLWFWAKGAIANMFESFLPENLAKTVTNVVFGILALYFIIKFLGRR